jgi:hypothetical protein
MANKKDNNLVYNDQLVELLSLSLHKGETSLKHVPDLLRDLIQNERWQKRVIRKTGETQEFENFIDFVEKQPLEGLGSNIYALRILCSGSPDVVRMIDELVQNGNSSLSNYPYLIEYLKKDNPELAQKLMDGEIDFKTTSQLLGFSKHRILLNPVDIERTGEKIVKIFNAEWKKDSKKALSELVDYLNKYIHR